MHSLFGFFKPDNPPLRPMGETKSPKKSLTVGLLKAVLSSSSNG